MVWRRLCADDVVGCGGDRVEDVECDDVGCDEVECDDVEWDDVEWDDVEWDDDVCAVVGS